MRRKHVPQRMCIACRQTRPKRELVRIVRLATGGVVIDPTGKRSGRGAYLCHQRQCWERALKENQLERALKTQFTQAEKRALEEFAHGLAEDRGERIETA